jgi:ABC-type oligopeptide transport system substrate-binding subunit
MKTRIAAVLAALAVLAAFSAVASGATSTTTTGKLKSFTYTKSSKVGHLRIKANKVTKYKITSNTDCGVHRGDSGDKIPCKTLGQPKYDNKVVRVTYTTNSKGTRKASLVAVDM